MKYINHMTCAFDDSKIQALVSKCGLKGYGAYWVIAESIAAQIRPESISTEWTVSWSALARRLGYVRTTLVQRLIHIMAAEGLITLSKRSDKLVTIDMPNLLKYADEYHKKHLKKKSGQSPDSVGTNSGIQALQALQTKKDLKAGACGIVDNSPADDGANGTGIALEGIPVPAPCLMVGNLTPEQLIKAIPKVRPNEKADVKWQTPKNHK